MATGQHKIRIYDLAKELKLDNKKVMEDARREGIDVSVPSNTVPHEVAERIRLKYFPKKIVPQVGPRLVKHVKQVEAVEAPQEEPTPVEPEVEVAAEAKPAPPPAAPEPPRPKVRVLKATPQPQPAEPSPTPIVEEPEPQVAESAEPTPGTTPAAQPVGIPPAQRPPTQVRVLRPRPGVPAAAPNPARGAGGATAGFSGAPGGTGGLRAVGTESGVATEPGATPARPRTTYVPQDTGRPRKRTRRGKRGPGEFGHEEGKHVELPRHMRGPGTVVQPKAKPVFTELRPLKLIE